MNAVPQNHKKLLLLFSVIFGAVSAIDFMFYGREIRDVAMFFGFGLIIFGVMNSKVGASRCGALLVVLAVLAKYA